MQKTFSDLINFKRTPDSATVSFLRDVVDAHPYCQPARMLLAKALLEVDAHYSGQHISIALAVAPDKRILRAFLKDRHPMLLSKSNASQSVQVKKETGQDAAKHDGGAASSKERKRRQTGIINRFLEKNPRIEARRDDVPVGDLCRESIEYKEGVASETLAEILLRQGKKQEAAMIYHQLSLMFPEKSSYFAKKLRNI